MTFVVSENCIKCKYMDCVEVCPVDCFHEGPNFLTIDPDECIDCTLCEPECPIEAIFSEEELPAGQEHYKQLNAELAKKWPVITEKKEAPADAKEWEGKPDKLKLLEREASAAATGLPSAAVPARRAANNRLSTRRSPARSREFPATRNPGPARSAWP